MRYRFPNTSRAKKAAKQLAASLPSVPLSSAQRAVARGLGYRDWHDLETDVAGGPPCALDQDLAPDAFVARQAAIVMAVAADLGVPDGDVQYALSMARLAGDREVMLDEQIAIRVACWRAGDLPYLGGKEPGAVGRTRVEGHDSEAAILRFRGAPCRLLTENGLPFVADFEYAPGPADALPFVPMRLYMSYGVWTEADGARVVFSRDYKPLWRLREGREPERVEPWAWIRHVDQEWLWSEGDEPWRSPRTRVAALGYLKSNGIRRLPILADALPLLVKDSGASKFADGADLLKAQRAPSPVAA